MWGPVASLMLRYSAGPGPSALEPGALKQVEQRHGWPDWYACEPGKCALQAQGHWSVTFRRTERAESNLESKWRLFVVRFTCKLWISVMEIVFISFTCRFKCAIEINHSVTSKSSAPGQNGPFKNNIGYYKYDCIVLSRNIKYNKIERLKESTSNYMQYSSN